MGNRESAAATTTIIGITDRMRPQKKRGTGSIHSLVGNTKDNIFGVSVVQTNMVTIETVTKATREIMEETRATNIRAIQMQATTTGGPQDCIMWMNTGT